MGSAVDGILRFVRRSFDAAARPERIARQLRSAVGLDEIVEVVDNGSDTPGTVPTTRNEEGKTIGDHVSAPVNAYLLTRSTDCSAASREPR